MSKNITYNDSSSSHLTSYDDEYSAYSVSNLANAYADSSNASYAQINLTRNANAVTQIYYNFGSLNIPTGATINSITCSCKCSINQTNSSRITTRQAQLYRGTTAMGTAHTVGNSTTAFNITPGTWTVAQLNDGVKLRLYAVRGTSNTTSSYYFRLYGATLTVNYSVNGIAYEITATSNASDVTISPATQDVVQGREGSVTVNNKTNVIITDNGVDVTANFVQASDTVTKVPESASSSNISGGSSYVNYAVGHSAENPNSSNGNMYGPSGSTGRVDYSFDFSDIPSAATITNVEVRLYGKRENASVDSTHKAEVTLYSGSTLKSTAQEFTSTSMQLITISNVGSWTADELHNAILRFTVGYYGGAISGISWEVSYEIDGFVYTITNISADHVIIVNPIGGAEDIIFRKILSSWVQAAIIYLKVSGTWKQVSKVYKKVNGSWVEQTDKSAMFNSNAVYINN